MAHFAKVNHNSLVSSVLVVSNDVIVNGEGIEDEALGQEFLAGLGMGDGWLQCSYNGSIRKNYPGVGFTYDESRDAFIPPTPYPSWVLDEDTCLWVAPVPMPQDGDYTWDESAGEWVAVSEA